MTVASNAAAVFVGVLILTPLHIFLSGDTNSSAEDNDVIKLAKELQSGKTAWDLLKDLQTDLEGNNNNNNKNNNINVKKKPEEVKSDRIRGLSSANPLKLVFTLWAKDNEDEKTEADKVVDRKLEDNGDNPLANGVGMSLCSIILLAVIVVLMLDLGEKVRVSFGSKPVEQTVSEELLDDANQELPSHRIQEYMTNQKKSRVSSTPSPRRKVTMGFEKARQRGDEIGASKTSTQHHHHRPRKASLDTETATETQEISHKHMEPCTSGIYHQSQAKGTMRDKDALKKRMDCGERDADHAARAVNKFYSSSQSELIELGAAENQSAIGDNIRHSSCSFALESNPSAVHFSKLAAKHQEQQQPANGGPDTKLVLKPAPFVSCLLQCLCHCRLFKYFFVDGPSQLVFGPEENLASPLTQLFAGFIRDAWQGRKAFNAHKVQKEWTDEVCRRFENPTLSFDTYLSTLFLNLYTDLKRAWEDRQHFKSLPSRIRKMQHVLLSGLLERRQLLAKITDLEGNEVPREIFAHSAITFPVTFSESVSEVLNKAYDFSKAGTSVKIEKERMEVPLMLNFHHPSHYFTCFPEKVCFHHTTEEEGSCTSLENSADIFELYAVCYQLVPLNAFSVALNHALTRVWYYTEGLPVIECSNPTLRTPKNTTPGVELKPVVLMYINEKWSAKLPRFKPGKQAGEDIQA